MPKNKTTATATTVGPTGDAPALPPAAQIVLALLHAESPSTAADLCDRAGLARSTVTKALGTLLERGLATRQEGGHDGARRIADRWFAAREASAPRVAADDTAEAQPGADASDGDSGTSVVKKADGDSESAPDREGIDGGQHGDGDETNAEAATVADAAPANIRQAEAIPAAEDRDAIAGIEDGVSASPEPGGGAVGDALAEMLAEAGADTGEADADDDRQSAAGEQSPGAADAAGDAQPAPVALDGEAAASRLGKGALRAMVEAHLRENPGQAWTPSAISKVLGRSAGAINNACLKLTETATVTTFPDKPTRFQWTGDANPDAS